MSYFAGGVGSYSTTSALTINQSNVLVNINVTLTLPTLPPDGTILTLRNTSTTNPTISAGTFSVRNVGSASVATSFRMVPNGVYMLCYYGGIWYGI